ncbi:MAG: hypothetical protein GXO00_01765 [Candidatus Diapherotrites archaeon]|nr:hypothetical protein [Candidatus Diapherotrites archaeon]
MSIVTVLVLWRSVVSAVPTGWTEEMVLAFALFLEIYYIVRSYIRDIIWAYGEFFIFGWIQPFLKPGSLLYVIIENNDGGFILASLIKLLVLGGALMLLFEGWWKGLVLFLLGMAVLAGFEMFVVGISLLLIESGRLWDLFYALVGYVINIPADFFRGLAGFFVRTVVPLYFFVTVPAKAVFGIPDDLPLLLALTALWLAAGYWTLRKALESAEAYGG